jgi:hypothetical protein
MRLLRPGWCRAALTGAALALGLITALAAAAGTPAMAATSSSSHTAPAMAATSSSSHITPAIAAREGLIRSPLGWHTANMTSRLCSSSTAHWFTIHINYLDGSYQYYCFGGTGTWYFPSNVFLWACAGNNHGSFGWYPPTGGTDSTSFSAGWSRSFPTYSDADYLTINGWSGSDNC